MRVIDSSALIKYLVKEDNWENVEDFLREGCITLDLALKEAANALIKKVSRNQLDAKIALEIVKRLPGIVRIVSQGGYILRAIELAIKNKITIYDALFIALSIDMKIALVTSDQKQAQISKRYGVTTNLV